MTQIEFLSALQDGVRLDWRDKSSVTAHSLHRAGHIKPNGRGSWELTLSGEKYLRYLISQRHRRLAK